MGHKLFLSIIDRSIGAKSYPGMVQLRNKQKKIENNINNNALLAFRVIKRKGALNKEFLLSRYFLSIRRNEGNWKTDLTCGKCLKDVNVITLR